MLIWLALSILVVVLIFQRSLPPVPFGEPRPLDLGVFFAWTVAAYSVFPLIGTALANLGIGDLQEARLDGIPQEMAVFSVGFMYLLFLTGFALSYNTVRKCSYKNMSVPSWNLPSRRDILVVAILLLSLKLCLFAARMALDIKQGDNYLATYTEFVEQPLLVQQIVGILAAWELPASILLIVVVIARDTRLHLWVGAFVAAQIVIAIAGGGGRTYAFACALAYLAARTLFDRNMRSSAVVIAGVAGLLIFVVAGQLRHSMIANEELPSLYILQGGEFLSLFTNALDLSEKRIYLEDQQFRIGLYLVDIMRLFPRQIVGDLKLDPAVFYVTTFYPEFSREGGGLAFGAISESALGFGPIEALVRGALIGGLYAMVARACLGRHRNVTRAFIYTWFLVLSYQAIRDTTLSVFPRFVFQMVPILLLLKMTRTLNPREHLANLKDRS